MLEWMLKTAPCEHGWSGIANYMKTHDMHTTFYFWGERHDRGLFRSWQHLVLCILQDEPDPYRVYWFYDTTGKTGKTWLRNYLMTFDKAITFHSKLQKREMARLYKKESTVLFDLTDINAQDDKCTPLYDAMECLKNGTLLRHGKTIKRKNSSPPHVIVLATSEPDYTKLSTDRFKVYEIVGPHHAALDQDFSDEEVEEEGEEEKDEDSDDEEEEEEGEDEDSDDEEEAEESDGSLDSEESMEDDDDDDSDDESEEDLEDDSEDDSDKSSNGIETIKKRKCMQQSTPHTTLATKKTRKS
jgi:hypothetical protein